MRSMRKFLRCFSDAFWIEGREMEGELFDVDLPIFQIEDTVHTTSWIFAYSTSCEYLVIIGLFLYMLQYSTLLHT